MKKRFHLFKRNLLKKIFGLFSLSAALFIFEACYGTPQDFDAGMRVSGKVMSEETGLPLENIEVVNLGDQSMTLTDQEGRFVLSCLRDEIHLSVRDEQSIKDTVIRLSGMNAPLLIQLKKAR